MEYYYIEFEFCSHESLSRLIETAAKMQYDKEKNTEDIDNKWIKYFTEQELDRFNWPTEEEYEVTRKLLGNVYIKVVPSNEDMKDEWDIYSMFEAIKNGEYDIIGVKHYGEMTYRLEIDPHSYPYGGINSLKKLVTCYGHKLIAADNGIGRIQENDK
ncbi:hypothetical protein [Paenibacillus glacialis]|uniref:Uncharacterized protein n=1 Tax=Paenibacillus glacialis TaxID=494026 RepID=A0A162LXH9_9BACL|nr:hypothetical protein [Paenibacillus glacialis]OAB41317.1 hypothetical protein PGLA_16035 [Paenibacillus glacialis]